MIEEITNCTSCRLCRNQPPLLDNVRKGHVVWVGLSAVKVDCTDTQTPLSEDTNSGWLISEIESKSKGVKFYKTNIVKCLPLENGKIRYPTKSEMKSCYQNFLIELDFIKPKAVFLLGKQVSDFICRCYDISILRHNSNFQYNRFEVDGISFISIHHPSYIMVYKRKQIYKYIKAVSKNALNPSKIPLLASVIR